MPFDFLPPTLRQAFTLPHQAPEPGSAPRTAAPPPDWLVAGQARPADGVIRTRAQRATERRERAHDRIASDFAALVAKQREARQAGG